MTTARTALRTGAARGIGAATAKRLAGDGWNVALVGLEPGLLEAVARDCGPERALVFEADVRDYDAMERAAAETAARFGSIDVVFANAGIASLGQLEHADREIFERTIEVNLLGSWRTIRACLPHVIESRGYILQNASIGATMPSPVIGAYCASKAGVEALANCLRPEVAYKGVDVGVLYCSWIDTDMVRGATEFDTFNKLRGAMPGPLGKTTTLEKAVAATVRAIEQRSAIVTVPRFVRLAVRLRGLLWPLADRKARELAPELEASSRAEIAETGGLPAHTAAPPSS